jgi:hypothetical protein
MTGQVAGRPVAGGCETCPISSGFSKKQARGACFPSRSREGRIIRLEGAAGVRDDRGRALTPGPKRVGLSRRSGGSGFVHHLCRLRLIERRRPAPEEVERLLGLRTGLSGVGEDGETGVRTELHHLEREAEISDDRVVNMLDPGLVNADVVRRPSGAELLALRRQLPDEV